MSTDRQLKPYEQCRVSLRVVREHDPSCEQPHLNTSTAVYKFFDGLAELDREVFYCVHLDVRHRVVSCEEVSRGTLTNSLVHPREVYKAAIASNAHAVIVAHNHPSGDATFLEGRVFGRTNDSECVETSVYRTWAVPREYWLRIDPRHLLDPES